MRSSRAWWTRAPAYSPPSWSSPSSATWRTSRYTYHRILEYQSSLHFTAKDYSILLDIFLFLALCFSCFTPRTYIFCTLLHYKQSKTQSLFLLYFSTNFPFCFFLECILLLLSSNHSYKIHKFYHKCALPCINSSRLRVWSSPVLMALQFIIPPPCIVLILLFYIPSNSFHKHFQFFLLIFHFFLYTLD